MSWGIDRRDTARLPRRGSRRTPLTLRLVVAVLLAVALAVGTSYTLRSLNL